MKSNSKFFLLMFLASSATLLCRAQSPNQVISVAADKMNVLYIGIDNPVTIAVSGVSPAKVNAVISDNAGTITGSNGKFIAKVVRPGKTKILILEDGKEIAVQEFRAMYVAEPKAIIGNLSGNYSCYMHQLQNLENLRVEIPHFVHDLKFEVIAYSAHFIYQDKNKNPLILEINPADERSIHAIKEAYKSVLPGDKIIFENIKSLGPDGTQKKVDAITISVI